MSESYPPDINPNTLPEPREPISRPVAFESIQDDGRTLPLPAILRYNPADPYAVQAIFGEERPVTWTFGRELLANGLYESSGDGVMELWPCLSADGKATVMFALHSPKRPAATMLQASSRDIAEFLQATNRSIPMGYEYYYVDIDREINQHLIP